MTSSPGHATGLTLFTGRFGSGKSEAAISFALVLAKSEPGVVLIDLDIVTPYFRSRETQAVLAQRGVTVIAPLAIGRHLDTPAITPQILGAIEQVDHSTVLDVGGDRQGARALGQFSPAINRRGYTMHFVVNPYRPFTNSIEALSASIAEIQTSSRLKVTSLVSNPNLMDETTAEQITSGHALVERFSRQLGLPLTMVCLTPAWKKRLGANGFAQPTLLLERFLTHPWETPRSHSADGSGGRGEEGMP